jgi:hypothetical protein
MKIDHALTESRRRLLAFVLAALIVAAAAIRFSTLAIQSYWDDEAATVTIVKLGFWDMLRTIPKTESTPPLYYVLAWAWATVFGTSETALRSLSALFGTATVLVVYLAAKQLSSRRVALVATALVAFNPFLVWYSQEARSYALYTFLASVSFLFFVRFLRQPKSGFLWSWAIASALALLSHYFAIFLIAPEAAWLAVSARRRRGPVFAAIALVAAIGLALIPLARHQEQKPELMAQRAKVIQGEAGRRYSTRALGAKTVSNTSLTVRVLRIPKTFLVGGEIPAKREVTAIASVLILAAIWLLVFRATAQDRREAVPAIGIGAAMIAIPIVLAAAGKDYVLPYYLIAAIVPFGIAVATGFAVSRVGLVLAAALCVLSLGLVAAVDATPRYQRENWRGAANALGPAHVNRVLVVTPSDIATLLTDTPLPLYQPRLRQIRVGGASVSEIDILAVRVTGSALPTRLDNVPHRPFRLAAEEKDETFTLFRYVSPRPVHVTRQGLLKSHLGDWPPHRITIFTQPATDFGARATDVDAVGSRA